MTKRRARLAIVGVGLSLLAACSSSSGNGGAPVVDAGAEVATVHLPDGGSVRDAGAGDAGDATIADAREPSLDAFSTGEASEGDANFSDGSAGDADALDGSFSDGNSGDVIIIGPPHVDSSLPDAAPDAAPVLDACGICDRVWVCNGFADTWKSTGLESCADYRGTNVVATLYCEHGDTINYADPMNNDGTWAITSTGLALYYNDFGSTMEIDCTPGP